MNGGARPGAGRKKTKLARTGNLKRVEAEEILAAGDEKEDWLALLNATTTTSVAIIYPDGKDSEDAPTREVITIPDNKIRLEARKYLTDRRDGKAPQSLNLGGQLEHKIKVEIKDVGGRTKP
jgi:hypothetical protein